MNSISQNISSEQFRTPILFLVFNRPDTSTKVFETIRKMRPQKLFVSADGPRPEKIGEKETCDITRALVKTIDWDCEIHTLFHEKNQGCKNAVSTAINWFFEHVEMGIILEDDCVPELSFYQFCSELLEKYRNDNRVMMISGDNFLFNKIDMENSYFFSRYHFIWGWATWKRAWKLYDVTMTQWLDVKKKHAFLDQFSDKKERRFWLKILNATHQGQINTWDFQWAFTMWLNHGLSICPSSNLISNIGFNKDATHTSSTISRVSKLATSELQFPLKHPSFCYRNVYLDTLSYRNFFNKGNILGKLYFKVKSFIFSKKNS